MAANAASTPPATALQGSRPTPPTCMHPGRLTHDLLLLLLLLLLPGCRGETPEQEAAPATLTVFAAASLAEAFEAVAAAFEAERPGTDVVLNLAGSQQLARQLALGAPADVFAAADERQMQAAVETGRVAPGAPRPFARNRLVVVLPEDNPAGLARLQELARPGLRLVLAAPEVPAGRYAQAFLAQASRAPGFDAAFATDVRARVVSYEPNVRAVLAKVALGEADAGIVYASDLAGAAGARTARIEIPDVLNTVAVYPIAPVRDSAHPERARAFVDFVRSPAGQAILAQYGFLPAEARAAGPVPEV